MDITIDKPATMNGYSTHRAVAALTNGAPAQFVDNGSSVTIRTNADVPTDIKCFTLKAACGTKVNGQHRYFRQGDHIARKAWLSRKGMQHGFEVLAVHATSERMVVNKGEGFTMDATTFTGVLKITDATKFANAVMSGVGGPGKAFGLGMLSL